MAQDQMSAQDLSAMISGGNRALIISEKDVDLKSGPSNRIFVLKMAEGSLAAGGRGGGMGERKITTVMEFVCEGGACHKVFETTDEAKVGGFEVPFYISRIPMTLADGSEAMGYGAVDAQLVSDYAAKAR
jgi:hypothetical protein